MAGKKQELKTTLRFRPEKLAAYMVVGTEKENAQKAQEGAASQEPSEGDPD